jgi:membrane protein
LTDEAPAAPELDLDRQNAAQPNRGRHATDPTQIPGPGRLDIVWRLYRAIMEDRILLVAAGVTFYMLLALVPSLTAVVSIYGLFNDPASVVAQVDLLTGIAPPSVLQVLRDQLTRLTTESNNTLGITLIFSLAVALWSASAGVKALFEAMNIAYGEEERRSFIRLNAMGLLFTFGMAVSAVIVLAVIIALPAIIGFLPLGEGLQWAVRIAGYIIMLAVLLLALATLYRWGPSRELAKWRWITPGVILIVPLFGLVSVVFSWYVSNFTDDNAAYGSLGATIGLMTWLWITVTLVIIGAELNSEIEHQTARDTTTGPEEPLGERGAHMADSVGRAWPPDRHKLEKPIRPPRKRISWATMAFALPAALALGALRRRDGQ